MLVNHIATITTLLLQQNEILTELAESLQKEFEYFVTAPNMNEKALLAKKKQIEKVKNTIKANEFIFQKATKVNDIHSAYEALMVYKGITQSEFNLFMQNEKQITNDLQIIKDDLTKKIRISNRPVLGLNKLKEMAKNAGKSINY